MERFQLHDKITLVFEFGESSRRTEWLREIHRARVVLQARMLMLDRYVCREKEGTGADTMAREVQGFWPGSWCRFTSGKTLTKLDLSDN